MIHQAIATDAERKSLINRGGLLFWFHSFNEFAAMCIQWVVREFVGAGGRPTLGQRAGAKRPVCIAILRGEIKCFWIGD